QQSTIDTFVIQSADAFTAPLATGQQANILFSLDDFNGRSRNARSNDDFNKLPLNDCFRRFFIQLTVKCNDAAKGGFRVGGVSKIVSSFDIAADGNSTGVCVFDN